MNNANDIVLAALDMNPDYTASCCAMRASGPEQAGSYFPGLAAKDVEAIVRDADWQPFEHEAIKAPARGFIADVGHQAIVGVLPLSDVPADVELLLDDSKDTGKVSAIWVVSREEVGMVTARHVVALVGPEGELWTFFPGDPIPPSEVDRFRSDAFPVCHRADIATLAAAGRDRHGCRVTRDCAALLGIENVKIRVKRNGEG